VAGGGRTPKESSPLFHRVSCRRDLESPGRTFSLGSLLGFRKL